LGTAASFILQCSIFCGVFLKESKNNGLSPIYGTECHPVWGGWRDRDGRLYLTAPAA
jgi:hypothetical protein